MKNQEILDDDLLNNDKVIDKRTEKPWQRSIIYLIIMMIVSGGYLYMQYQKTLFNPPLSFYIESAFSEILLCFLVSSILEFFRFLIRKFRKTEVNVLNLIDPLWFQITEGAFAIWIIMTVVKVIISEFI